ncbi:MAG TPA: DUF1569 domain-containing protein [Terriglobales bacterium]|nr:DUF1569 domain-containing protein [Terriglobales bacterium]
MHRLLQKALGDIDSATAGMTEPELRCHPQGKWCAAEILEHLSLAFEHTVRGMNRCLAAGKNLGDEPTLKQRIFHAVVLDLRHFPTGRKSPELVAPKGELGGLEALEKIRTNLIAMDQTLAVCREKLGTRGRLANHPILGPLTNEQWCTFHYVHTRHHMKQIRALRDQRNAKAVEARG